ncbi:plasmid replication protein, CyRepA1 family [Chamaesiphon sp. VAR_48_metabat_135_sub]|uniref:plasmid replication protein, CyRepA1 family n=1 Tax=Chamaesiphon sp. VAR_48_metabat_135_sub TaxID=2964699 RepID=UPI00286ADDD0|nr:plasmid replication protein, CyRepA1 family [Chamaesiphon sp. VAR_48_metabat_135_sub]
MVQTYLQHIHYIELVTDSNIDRALVALNFKSLQDNSVYDRLFISPQIQRNNSGQVIPSWMKRYHHCAKGGWWCGGLDPLNNWQPMEWGTFKPDFPTKNRDEKIIKYEHPPSISTRLFCLRVTKEVWQQTAILFKAKLPPEIKITSGGEAIGFWQWILDCQIPIVICEGVKKAATLLTYGYPAIALPGINSGYRVIRDSLGNTIERKPIPELEIFANRRQQISICFDYEAVPHKARLLDTAIEHLGELLQRSGCNVKVMRLPGPEKGIDDSIVARGIAIFKEVDRQSLDLEMDLARSKRHSELTYPANLILESRYLHRLDLPSSGIVGIKSAKGTGKTTALIPVVAIAQEHHRPVLLLTHRIQLGRFLCQRIGVNWINEQLPKQASASLGLCLDSMWKLNPSDWEGGVIILDEVEQSLWHLLHSSTCKKKRLAILKTFQHLIARVVETNGLIVAQDADLSDISIDYLKRLANNEIEPWIAVNQWQAERGWDVHFYDSPNPTALIHQLELDLRAGHKCYVTTDSRSGRYGSDTIDRYIKQTLKQLEDSYTKTLVVCSYTTSTTGHPAVDFVSAINTQAPAYDAVFVTPTLGTGVSIDVNHFDRVYGIFQGVIPDAEVRQALARVRANVPRYLWCAKRGLGTIGSGSNNYRSLAYWYQENYKENYALMCPLTRIDVDEQFIFDPIHLRTWARFAARINASITLYREAVKSGLLGEGHQIHIISEDRDKESLQALRTALIHATKTDPKKSLEIMRQIADIHKEKSQRDREYNLIGTQTKKIQQQVKSQAAQAIATAPDLGHRDYQYLTNKRFLTDLERAQIEKYNLQQRYGVTVTPELKLKDDKGYYGQLLTHFYLLNHQQYLPQSIYLVWDRDLAATPEQVFLPDANHHILKIQGLLALGIINFLDIDRQLKITDPDLISLKRISYLCSKHIKRAIGIDLPNYNNGEVSSIAILNRFLQLLGLKMQPIQAGLKKQEKNDSIYQLDRSLLNDGRDEIFKIWQHQQSRELVRCA